MFDKYHPLLQLSAIVVFITGLLYITPSHISLFFPIFLVVVAIYHTYSGRSPTDSDKQETESQHFSDRDVDSADPNSLPDSQNMLRPTSGTRSHSTPIHRSMGATQSLKKPNNENRLYPLSPNVSVIDRPRAQATGIFGQAPVAPNQLLNSSLQGNASFVGSKSPSFLQHLDSNKQVLGDAQNRSSNDSPLFTPNPSMKKRGSLPKVYRHYDRDQEYTPEVPVQGQTKYPTRRYPTHQPQYEGIGIMPMVRLQQRGNTSIHDEPNSSLLAGSPVTVKIAPPDVLKPPPPIFIPVSEPQIRKTTDPCNSETVVSALREKRKRTFKDDCESGYSPVQQGNKRRKADRVESPAQNGEDAEKMDISSLRISRLKRPAISQDREDSEDEGTQGGDSKRTRTVSACSSQPSSAHSSGGGLRNPIDVSFSSSKRWLKKQAREKSLNACRESSISREVRGRSRDRQTNEKGTRSRSSSGARTGQGSANSSIKEKEPASPTRRQMLDIEEDLMVGSATSTPVASCSGRSTPASLSQDELSESRSGTPKRRPLLLQKKGSTKRRLAPLHSDVADSLSKMPQLRYTLTVEELERDRQAERERVLQTLDEVEEGHKAKQEKKTLAIGKQTPVSQVEAPTTTAEAVSTAKTSLPLLSSQASNTTPTTVTVPSILSTLAPKTQTSTAASSSLVVTTSALAVTSNKSLAVTPAFSVAPQTSLAGTSQAFGSLTSSAANLLSTAKSSTSSIAAPSQQPALSLAGPPQSSLGLTFGAKTGTPSALSTTTTTTTSTPNTQAITTLLTSSAQPSTTVSTGSLPTGTGIFGSSLGVSKPSPAAAVAGTLATSSTSGADTNKPSPFNFNGGNPTVTSNGVLSAAKPTTDKPAAATTLNFGAPQQPGPAVNFGQPSLAAPNKSNPTVAPTTTASNFTFGATGTGSAPMFGATSSAPAFGTVGKPALPPAPAAPAPSSGFTFGAATGQPTTTTTGSGAVGATSIFSIGAANPAPATTTAAATGAPNNTASNPFQFGKTPQSAPTSNIFGMKPNVTSAATATAATSIASIVPAFGQPAAAPSGNMFGQGTSVTPNTQASSSSSTQSGLFQFGAGNKPATAPMFGNPAAGANKPGGVFGAAVSTTATTTTKAPSVFGSTAGAPSTNMFGSGTSTVTPFGGGAGANQPTAFGQPQQQQQQQQQQPSMFGAGTGSAAPNVNPFGVGSNSTNTSSGSSNVFGQQQQQQQTASNTAQSGGFNFGAATAAPKMSGGFNFGAANAAPAFGAGSTGSTTLGRTASAPTFGAMAGTPAATPALPFAPSTPEGQTGGAFSIGANSAPRRPTARGARRRPQRK